MIKKCTCVLLFLVLSATLLHATEVKGRVTWIYDGDTLEVEKIGKVRLIGIDTPEYKASKRDNYYSKNHDIEADKLREISRQAKRFNIENAKGKRVRLVTGKNERDKHGRLLVYLYLPGGDMLNRLLLKKGLATVFRRYDFRYKKEFLKLEQKARHKKRGLWSK
jgi:micrococcal nuclease